jgi:two-component system, cell cycle response regulator
MKILVADDDRVSRRLMQGILERNGYEVLLTEDGLSACRALMNADSPRLALIDWMMPKLDGPGVCREVRRCRKDSYVYIALLTAKQANADIVEGLEAGADDYLTKPCHPAELKARLLTGRRILSYEDTLVKSREDMRYRATHDSLTDLANRASILSDLRQAMESAALRKNDLSVLLCDIDHFKSINDRFGHLVGDNVLGEVAKRLSRSVRKADIVGRLGGEEFLVVLDGCGVGDLKPCAEQVCTAVGGTKIHYRENVLDVSISIGAATFQGWRGDMSLEQLLRQADEALYEAKALGRNRVSIWGSSPLSKIPTCASDSVN